MCDEHVKQRTKVYQAQFLQYWRQVKQTKVANRGKLLRVQAIHQQLCCKSVVSAWRQRVSAIKLTEHNDRKHDVQLLTEAFGEWKGELKQSQLNRVADIHLQNVRLHAAVNQFRHHVATNKADQAQQQSVGQAVTVILLKHTFLHWKQYLMYTHKIDAAAEQHYKQRNMKQAVQCLYDRALHKRNIAAVQHRQAHSMLHQAFSVWRSHIQQNVTVGQTNRLRYSFRLWYIHHREHQYNARHNMKLQQQCMTIWVQQHNQLTRMNEQEAVSERIYAARVLRHCYNMWTHELKQQQRLNKLTELQTAKLHRRQQKDALQRLTEFHTRCQQCKQQLELAQAFNLTVQTHRARYYLLLWNYELKYKSVVQHTYEHAVAYHLHRNAATMQYYLYDWLKRCKVDALHREHTRAVQTKLVRQNYAHFFAVWQAQYVQARHKRDVAQFAADVQLRMLRESFAEWRACLYDNLADEKQYKHVQVQMYERNTTLAQQYRANLVLNLLQHSNKRKHQTSVQHFCFMQLRRYVQYRKQQAQLIEQAHCHYMHLLQKHALIIWQYKLYQADKMRQCDLFRVKHCFKRGVSALVTNILQRTLQQKNNELSVQYWKYGTTRLVFRIMVCVHRNNVEIRHKFDTLLMRRYFHEMHGQCVYERMLKQQEALCVKHYGDEPVRCSTASVAAVVQGWCAAQWRGGDACGVCGAAAAGQ